MSAIGARFVVVRHREIVGSVDVETGLVRDASALAAFSPRARDYTGEPGLSFLARAMRDRFGAAAVVMTLVPRDVDAGLFDGRSKLDLETDATDLVAGRSSLERSDRE